MGGAWFPGSPFYSSTAPPACDSEGDAAPPRLVIKHKTVLQQIVALGSRPRVWVGWWGERRSCVVCGVGCKELAKTPPKAGGTLIRPGFSLGTWDFAVNWGLEGNRVQRRATERNRGLE